MAITRKASPTGGVDADTGTDAASDLEELVQTRNGVDDPAGYVLGPCLHAHT
jgi:hypothetical protein